VLTVKAADGEVQQHDVYLQDLPTVVESYKTLDDANLVKVTDIGQVRCCPSH
jgi:TATA-binding protein-associated factor Taf7